MSVKTLREDIWQSQQEIVRKKNVQRLFVSVNSKLNNAAYSENARIERIEYIFLKTAEINKELGQNLTFILTSLHKPNVM